MRAFIQPLNEKLSNPVVVIQSIPESVNEEVVRSILVNAFSEILNAMVACRFEKEEK